MKLSNTNRSRARMGILTAGVVAAAAAGGAVATGAIPSSGSGEITGCYTNGGSLGGLLGGGNLRVIDAEAGQTCRTNEKKLAWSQRGQPGPAGPEGAQGPEGPAGPPGESGPVKGHEIVEAHTEMSTDDSKLATVSCPPGKLVVGGGANPTQRGVAVTNSAPGFSTPANGRGWVARAEELPDRSVSWALFVYAICAEVEE